MTKTNVRSSLSDSDDIRFLNLHHDYPNRVAENLPDDSLLKRIKRNLRNYCRQILLGEDNLEQAKFRLALVRHLNSLTSRFDEQFFRDIKLEQEAVALGLEKKFAQLMDTQSARTIAEISALQTGLEIQSNQLKTLDAVTRGLEQIIASLKQKQQATPDESPKSIDYSYLMLENRYRGGESEIKNRLKDYPQYFVGAQGPVLEIGSGRGELLELLREQNIPSYGIEIDPAMVDHASNKGLEVKFENALSHLQALPPNSLGGLIAVQVVEHLSFPQLQSLLNLAPRAVISGGKIIVETINSRSLVSLCHNYFRDPTHTQPLHPDTLRYLMEQAGLKIVDIQERSFFPGEVGLQENPVEPYMTPRWQLAIERINHNTRLLNSLLFGAQDYCVIAEA